MELGSAACRTDLTGVALLRLLRCEAQPDLPAVPTPLATTMRGHQKGTEGGADASEMLDRFVMSPSQSPSSDPNSEPPAQADSC